MLTNSSMYHTIIIVVVVVSVPINKMLNIYFIKMHLKLISQSLAFIKHKINKFLLKLYVHNAVVQMHPKKIVSE